MSHALDNAGHNCEPADAGRGAGDDEGVRDRSRTAPFGGRSAAAVRRVACSAPGRQRLSGGLSRHHAAVHVHGRVVVRDAVRRTSSGCAGISRAHAVGPGRDLRPGRRPPRSSTTRTRPTRSPSQTSSRTGASPLGPAPACRSQVYNGRTTRAACAARSRTTWSTRSAATRAGSPAAASTTSGFSTDSRGCGRGGSRRLSSWTSTPTLAGRTWTST